MTPVFGLLLLGAGAGLLFFFSRQASASGKDLDLPPDLLLGWKQAVLESARTGTVHLMVQTADIARTQGHKHASDEMFKWAERFQNGSDGVKVALATAVNTRNLAAVSAVSVAAENNGEAGFAAFSRVVEQFLRELIRAGG